MRGNKGEKRVAYTGALEKEVEMCHFEWEEKRNRLEVVSESSGHARADKPVTRVSTPRLRNVHFGWGCLSLPRIGTVSSVD
jgi:hypothetical protein